MAEIKSAYERAMERFKDVEPDRNSLKRKEKKDRAKLLCAKMLQGEDINLATEIETISKVDAKEKLDKNGVEIFKEGMGETLLAQIVLPSSEQDIHKIDNIKKVLAYIANEVDEAMDIMEQYKSMSKDYIDNKVALTENIKTQYMKFVEQQGQATPQMEANLMKTMQEQIKSLDDEYRPVVQEVREVLVRLCNLTVES